MLWRLEFMFCFGGYTGSESCPESDYTEGSWFRLYFSRAKNVIGLISLHLLCQYHHHHHQHRVREGLGMLSCSLILKISWSLHLFLGRPTFLRPFGLYCSACFGSLFVSILCTCCSHFSWYPFISFTVFCAPVSSLIH